MITREFMLRCDREYCLNLFSISLNKETGKLIFYVIHFFLEEDELDLEKKANKKEKQGELKG